MSRRTERTLKFGSSGTLEGIQDVIAAFYCGERKPLVADGEGVWSLQRSNGTTIPSVRVRLHRGRYVFERSQ